MCWERNTKRAKETPNLTNFSKPTTSTTQNSGPEAAEEAEAAAAAAEGGREVLPEAAAVATG